MKRCLLEYPKGLLQRTLFILEGQTTMGRSRKSSLALDDPSISRHHATLAPEESGWVLRDLRSRNGTFVNETKVDRCVLRHGDHIRLGSVHMRFIEMELREVPQSVTETAEAPAAGAEPGEQVPMVISQQEIDSQLDLVKTFLDALPLGVAILNERLHALYFNHALASFQGDDLESDEVTLGALLGCPSVFGGASPCGFFPECPVCRIREPLRKTFREGSPLVDLELPWRKKTESELSHIRLSAIPLPFRLSGEPLALLTLEDVTQRKSSEEEIRRLAYHDSLTGLPNRTLFYDRLKVAMAQARRSRKGLAVMFLDLDRFKEVNDSLGHSVGDALLKVAGERLNGLLRKGDTVSRMGGDEFLLMLPETSRHEDAARIARKILDAFQEPFAVGGHEIRITTSIGIALYPEEGEDADTLMKKADIAMYRAKEMGRNNYQCSGRDGDGEPVGGPTPESVGGSGQQDG